MTPATDDWMPTWHTAPGCAWSGGPHVTELCASAGITLAPEQRLVLDHVFGGGGGKSAASAIAMIGANRELVDGTLEACALGWLYLSTARTIAWSSYGREAVRGTLDRLETVINDSMMLRSQVGLVSRLNGGESISLRDGSRLLIFNRRQNSGAGRGLAVDKLILDDAHNLDPRHLHSILPALVSAPDPQIVYGSPDQASTISSPVMQTVISDGRTARNPNLAYAEWTA